MGKGKKPLPEANELEALFSEKQVGPYLVKPWSFGKAIKVYPALAQAIARLQDQGKTWEEVVKAFESGLAQEILAVLLPVLPPLVAATLEVPLEEVEALDMGLGAALAFTILSQNLTQIKNFLPLIVDSIKAMVRAA
jgi:hypothetical protein